MVRRKWVGRNLKASKGWICIKPLICGLFAVASAAAQPQRVMTNDWEFSSTPEACFLWRSIDALDQKIRRSSLVLGQLELLASSSGGPSSQLFARVVTAVEAVEQATTVVLRTKLRDAISLRSHRPGGKELRYAQFNATPEHAQQLVHALTSGGPIDIEFKVGLFRRVRGLVTPDKFSTEHAKFIACAKALGEREPAPSR